MFRHTKQLAYKVRVDKPNPIFAKALQQAIGGVEGEIRICLQYLFQLFQGWGNRGADRYKDMLLNTGTEEIGHIEMLATAVALNLEKAPSRIQEEVADGDGVDARWTSGSSVDSKGKFGVRQAEPMGEVPKLVPAEERPELHSIPIAAKGGILRAAKDALTP
jgi:Mn-containing catalase